MLAPIRTDDGIRLAYQVDGPADAPAVLFLNGLGTDLHMWEPQVVALIERFRLVRFDMRGHGHSDVPPGPCTLDRLARDALTVLDAIDVERAHLCGLSLGGMVALWLAIHRPSRVGRAVFANTAARIGSDEIWNVRIEAVQAGGMAAVHEAALTRWLSPEFRQVHPEVVRTVSEMFLSTSPRGYIACCAALHDADLRHLVSTITAPSLVIGAELDRSTPPAQAEDLHAAIVPSELMVIPGVAHLSNLEAPDLFSLRVLQLFSRP